MFDKLNKVLEQRASQGLTWPLQWRPGDPFSRLNMVLDEKGVPKPDRQIDELPLPGTSTRLRRIIDKDGRTTYHRVWPGAGVHGSEKTLRFEDLLEVRCWLLEKGYLHE